MDFNQQSFGSLLFSLENESLKKEIRNIEKMNKRLIYIKSGINFNNLYIICVNSDEAGLPDVKIVLMFH